MENTITIEDKQYDFITSGFIRPTAPIRRFSQGSNRFYYTVDEGDITLYSSGTTLIKDGYAESEIYLEDWRNKLKAEGKDPKYELSFAALRGTLLHILAGDYIQQKQIRLNDLNGYFSEFHPEVLLEPLYKDVITKDSLWLQKSILSFTVFCKEYNVKPLAIELMLKSEKYKVASPVDLIAEITIIEKGFFGEVYKSGVNKGQPKETKQEKKIIAIIDLKSSKAFYDKHQLQLLLYKDMVNENYPEIEIGGIYNWSPKEWVGTEPTYNFKEQSSGRLNELAYTVFEQGRIKHSWKTPVVNVVPDTIVFGEEVEFRQVPLVEFLKNKHIDGKERGDKKET